MAGASGVPRLLVGEVLEPSNELLDPGIVGENFAGRRKLAAKQPAQNRIEEQHRVAAERPIWTARLEEMDRRAGQPAELDFAGDAFDQLVALLVGRFGRQVHGRGPPIGRDGGTSAGAVCSIASWNAWYEVAPLRAKMTWLMAGERS